MRWRDIRWRMFDGFHRSRNGREDGHFRCSAMGAGACAFRSRYWQPGL